MRDPTLPTNTRSRPCVCHEAELDENRRDRLCGVTTVILAGRSGSRNPGRDEREPEPSLASVTTARQPTSLSRGRPHTVTPATDDLRIDDAAFDDRRWIRPRRTASAVAGRLAQPAPRREDHAIAGIRFLSPVYDPSRGDDGGLGDPIGRTRASRRPTARRRDRERDRVGQVFHAGRAEGDGAGTGAIRLLTPADDPIAGSASGEPARRPTRKSCCCAIGPASSTHGRFLKKLQIAYAEPAIRVDGTLGKIGGGYRMTGASSPLVPTSDRGDGRASRRRCSCPRSTASSRRSRARRCRSRRDRSCLA